MPSRVGSVVALPCHVVRSMERIGTRLPGAPGRKTWRIDTRNKNQRGPVLSPMDSDQGRLFHETGSRLVHRYRVYKDPFPHPALRDGVIPRLLSSVCQAMAIAHLTHLRLSIPLSGAPPGKVPESCFPNAETAVAQPPPCHMSFTEDANTLCTEDDSSVLSHISPPLTKPVVEVTDEDDPASEGDGLQTCSPESKIIWPSVKSSAVP